MLQIVILIGLSILILFWPYLGIAVTLASLPLTDILPEISWASSVVPILGGVTLVSYLFRLLMLKRNTTRSRLSGSPVLVTGFLFLLWIILSNPSAAFTSASDERIWVITFIQLWALAWLTASLLDNTKKVDTLMWFFFIATLISAVYASYQGVIGSNIELSVRASGLAGAANSAARYFVIALLFVLFLYPKQKNRITKIFLIGGMAVLFYGVLVTVSRTGLLLLVGGAGLLIIKNLQTKRKTQSVYFILVALFVVWFFAENIISIFKNILPSVLEGQETVGIRYGLWQAGLRMWFDHPINGVGIGQFSNNLPRYAWDLLSSQYLMLGAHNMYIAVLSETGIIGLLLFLAMFAFVFRDILKARRSKSTNISELANNWLIVIILILLAGITKHDHYDKLNWIVAGISVSISRIKNREQSIQSN